MLMDMEIGYDTNKKSYFSRDNIYVGAISEYPKLNLSMYDEVIEILDSKTRFCGSILFEKDDGMAHDLKNDVSYELDKIDNYFNQGVLDYINIGPILEKLGFNEILSQKDIKKIYKLFLKINKLYFEHAMCYGNNTEITNLLDKEEWDKLILICNMKNYKGKSKKLTNK